MENLYDKTIDTVKGMMGENNTTVPVPAPVIPTEFEMDVEKEQVYGGMGDEDWVNFSANLQGDNKIKAQALRARFFKKNGATDQEASDMVQVPNEYTSKADSPVFKEMIIGGWTYSASMAGGAAAGVEKVTGSETAGDIADEARSYVKYHKDMDSFNNLYNATYDEDTGDREHDWNVAKGVGEVAVPMKVGFGLDSMAKSKVGGIALNAAYGGAETAAFYAMDDDKTAAGVGLAAVALEGIVTSLFPGNTDKLMKTGKDMSSMQDSLYAAQLLDEKGINIPKSVFDDPDKLAKIIKEANTNIFDKSGAKLKLNAAQLSVVSTVQDTARAFNLTPAKLNDYLKGNISLEQTSKKFKDYVDSNTLEKTGYARRHYDAAKSMDIDVNGQPIKYESAEMVRDLYRLTENAPQVENVLNAAFKHKGRIETEDAFEARGITEKFTQVSTDLRKAQANQKKAQRAVIDYRGKLSEASDNVAAHTLEKWSNGLDDAMIAQTKFGREVKDLKSQKGSALREYRTFKDKLGIVDEGIYNIDDFKKNLPQEMSLDDAQALSVYINHKINIAGGSISVGDKTQIGKLKSIRSRLKGFIEEKAMQVDADGNLVNPGAANFLTEIKQGDKYTKSKYDLIGKDQGVAGMDAALKSRDVEAMGKLMQGPDAYSKLQYLKTVDGGAHKDMFDELSNIWAHNEILGGVTKPSKPGSPTFMDFNKLASNLNKPELMNQLDKIDPAAAKGARALKSLVNAYAQSLTELQKVSPSLGPDVGVMNNLKTFFSKAASPIQALRHIGNNVGSALWDPAAEAMGSGSRWRPLDEEATWNTAIGQITAEMSGEMNKKAKVDRFGDIINSIVVPGDMIKESK